MDLSAYRNRPIELARVSNLLELVPLDTQSALDVGERDGHISVLLADRVASVVSLDLTTPQIYDPSPIAAAATMGLCPTLSLLAFAWGIRLRAGIATEADSTVLPTESGICTVARARDRLYEGSLHPTLTGHRSAALI